MPGRPVAKAGIEPANIGFLVNDVLRLMREDFAARSRGMPLPPALHRLLIYIYRRPGSRQVELARWLDITPVTVGRMLDRLAKKRLVRRESHPEDRRASRIVVDEGAQALLGRLDAVAQQTRARALAGLTEAQRVELTRLLTRVRDNLSGVEPDRPRGSRARGR